MMINCIFTYEGCCIKLHSVKEMATEEESWSCLNSVPTVGSITELGEGLGHVRIRGFQLPISLSIRWAIHTVTVLYGVVW